MIGLLLSFIPDSFLILVIVFAGFALMLRIISPGTAFRIIGVVILIAMLMPFVDSLFESLPLWILLLMIMVFALSLFRGLLNMIFGRGATDEFVGHLMYDLFMLPFRIIRNLLVRRRIV